MDKAEFKKLVDQLKTQRDELKVQAHLFKEEVKDEWDELEKKWGHFETKVKSAEEAASESAPDVAAAASLLMQELKEGYQRVKERWKS